MIHDDDDDDDDSMIINIMMISYLRSPSLCFLGSPVSCPGASVQWSKKPGALSCVSSPSAGKGHWVIFPFLGSVNLEKHRAMMCQNTKSCFVCFRKMGEIMRNLENLNEEKSQQMFLK